MPISFLDLEPKALTESFTLDTARGPQEIELGGVSLQVLADISRRFPDLKKLLDGEIGSMMDNPDAVAAMVAASLGHPGDEKWESHAASFAPSHVIRMAHVIIRLTFPPPSGDADPLAEVVAGNGVDAASDQTSPLRLSA